MIWCVMPRIMHLFVFWSTMSETDMCVARTVTRLAELNGLSLKRLAEKLHMPYRTVQNYLTGNVKVPSDFIAQCCRIFAVEADYLLFNAVDLDQMALTLAINSVLRCILPDVEVSSDGLRLKASGSNAFDDPIARDFHESAMLRQLAAAIRNGYVRHRMGDLMNDDVATFAETVDPATS